MTALLLMLHTIAAIIWVGGMFFAHIVLRPAVGPMTPGDRLALWSRVFPRFFIWVWASVITLLTTGHFLIVEISGTMRNVGPFTLAMIGIGLVMAALFLLLYFVPYRQFRAAMARDDIPTAARHQGRIRLIVTINLLLGLITSALAAGGRLL